MSADGQSVFIGGEYYYLNGTPRNCIGRVDATTGALHSWAVPFTQIIDDAQTHKPGPNMLWAILVTPTRVYGGFGRVPNFLQAFRLDNGNSGDTVPGSKINTPGNVESLALSPDGTRLLAGGHFGTAMLDFSACGTWIHGLMNVSPATGAINCDWLPTIKPFRRFERA